MRSLSNFWSHFWSGFRPGVQSCPSAQKGGGWVSLWLALLVLGYGVWPACFTAFFQGQAGGWMITGQALLWWGASAFYWVWGPGWGAKRHWLGLGVKAADIKSTVWLLLAQMAWVALWAWLAPAQALVPDTGGGITPWLTMAWLGPVVLAPLTEELVFRGWWQGVLFGSQPMVKPWLVVLSSGLLFASLHPASASHGDLTWLWLWVYRAGLGCLYALSRQKTGSIWPPVVAHSVHNALVYF